MSEPRAVIVGTGRHGSGYIAALLCAVGVPCGHENWWNPHRGRLPGLVADSSWCALPYLRWYPGAVLHQVRHPLDVISSLVKLPNWGQYLTLAETVTGPLEGDPVDCAVATYLRLNQAAEEHAEQRWQVEQVDADLLDSICSRVQYQYDTERSQQAIAAVPTDTNYHGHGTRLGWDDLPDTPDRVELVAMALRYGYEA